VKKIKAKTVKQYMSNLKLSTNGRSLELIKFLLEQPTVNMNCQGKDGHTGMYMTWLEFVEEFV
jgi:hypothetical protein